MDRYPFAIACACVSAFTRPGTHDVVSATSEPVCSGYVVSELAAEFRPPHAPVVRFEHCAVANAYYHPDERAIVVCHELRDRRVRLFASAGYDPVAAERMARDAMTFTVFHEFGHALHSELRLPITGRGEDAADEIAAILLIDRGAEGRAVAAHAALAHYLRSTQPGHHDAYWDVHSSSAQRGVAIACLLYGADPIAHADLTKRLGIPGRRLAQCVRDYPFRVRAWQALLSPPR